MVQLSSLTIWAFFNMMNFIVLHLIRRKIMFNFHDITKTIVFFVLPVLFFLFYATGIYYSEYQKIMGLHLTYFDNMMALTIAIQCGIYYFYNLFRFYTRELYIGSNSPSYAILTFSFGLSSLLYGYFDVGLSISEALFLLGCIYFLFKLIRPSLSSVYGYMLCLIGGIGYVFENFIHPLFMFICVCLLLIGYTFFSFVSRKKPQLTADYFQKNE